VQGTAELHHEIADALLPQADPVFHHTTTLDAAVDMLDPEPSLVERLGESGGLESGVAALLDRPPAVGERHPRHTAVIGDDGNPFNKPCRQGF